ncbi:MAG: putative nitrogen fixation protein NifT [Nitrospinae bacterium]|nr:putative nitrogen fixation protein NifT [Nitrospinota bacterium]
MKVIVRKVGETLSVYIPKKDLEANVIATDPDHVFGGTIEIQGGMKLYIEPMEETPKLPLTMNAKKVA